jgi:TetR/AcrR family transcriptional repressor of nem operon
MATPLNELGVPSASTRDRILALGRELVQTRGYNGFSFQDIADRLEIRKASVHHHFATKEDLAVAVADAFRADFEGWASRVRVKYPAPLERLKAYLRMLQHVTEPGDRSCPFAMFVTEWSGLPPSVRVKVQRTLELARAFVIEAVDEAQRRGELRRTPDAASQADVFITALSGALQLGRAREDRALIQRITESLFTGFAA